LQAFSICKVIAILLGNEGNVKAFC